MWKTIQKSPQSSRERGLNKNINHLFITLQYLANPNKIHQVKVLRFHLF
jgi:hypothetical protein